MVLREWVGSRGWKFLVKVVAAWRVIGKGIGNLNRKWKLLEKEIGRWNRKVIQLTHNVKLIELRKVFFHTCPIELVDTGESFSQNVKLLPLYGGNVFGIEM